MAVWRAGLLPLAKATLASWPFSYLLGYPTMECLADVRLMAAMSLMREEE